MKRTLRAMVFFVGLVIAAGIISSAQSRDFVPLGKDDTGLTRNKVKRGLEIAPVKLNLTGKKQDLVGMGSYLVNAVGGCNDCHTNPSYAPGGNPFLGQPTKINAASYLAGGTKFGPVITSSNITPDASGKPAGLTYEQFLKTIRTGVDPDPAEPGRLLQVMPWPVYSKMTDKEIQAVYEYLSAIPHAETPK